MKLLFLHGAPASGKLTVARSLLQIVPGRLFDNHAAIDFARTMFEFGAPGFWELVLEARIAALEAAASQGVPLVVATFCYADPQDRPGFERFQAIARGAGGDLLPVYLACSEEATARRVGNPDRVQRRKISTMQGLRKFIEGYNITTVPREDCLRLDTSAVPAEETARTIVRHFRLA